MCIRDRHKGLLQFIIRLVLKYRGISPEEGADTLVYLATNETVQNVSGKYFITRSESNPSKEALRSDIADRLWQESIKLINRFLP